MIQDQSPSPALYYEFGFFWTNDSQFASGGGGGTGTDGKQFIGELQSFGIGPILDASMGVT